MTEVSEVAQSLVNALAPYGATSAIDFNDGQIGVTFCLAGDPNGIAWRKAVRVSPDGITPAGVLLLMNDWKRNTFISLDFAHPSDTIKFAIRQFGEQAVREALKPWPLH